MPMLQLSVLAARRRRTRFARTVSGQLAGCFAPRTNFRRSAGDVLDRMKRFTSGGLRRHEIDAVVRAHEMREKLRGRTRPGTGKRRAPAPVAIDVERGLGGGG